MAVAQGYGKTVTSGSVFAYDVADTRNSYKGQPTVNVFGTYPTDLYGWVNGGNQVTLSRDTIPSPVGNTPLKMVCNGNDPYTSTYGGTGNNIAAASSGQTWTISVWAKANQNTTGAIFHFGANSSGNIIDFNAIGISLTTEWTRYTYTRTFTDGNVVAIQARLDGPDSFQSGVVVWWDGLQVEQKAYVTQFVAGTRSATQGLLPLVGNSTLDLSNMSFDSNAQMTFDGTNDYISLPTSIVPTNEITIEFVCTKTDLGANNSIIAGGAGGNQDLSVHLPWGDGTVYWDCGRPFNRINKATTLAERSGVHHWVFTKNPSTGIMNIYLDGALWHTGGGLTSTLPSLSSVSLGRYDNGGSTGYYYPGNIPVTKIYDRALSAGEVRQNYLHYKTRFNLS